MDTLLLCTFHNISCFREHSEYSKLILLFTLSVHQGIGLNFALSYKNNQKMTLVNMQKYTCCFLIVHMISWFLETEMF